MQKEIFLGTIMSCRHRPSPASWHSAVHCSGHTYTTYFSCLENPPGNAPDDESFHSLVHYFTCSRWTATRTAAAAATAVGRARIRLDSDTLCQRRRNVATTATLSVLCKRMPNEEICCNRVRQLHFVLMRTVSIYFNTSTLGVVALQ